MASEEERKSIKQEFLISLVLFGVMGAVSGMIVVWIFDMRELVRVAQLVGALAGMVWAYKKT